MRLLAVLVLVGACGDDSLAITGSITQRFANDRGTTERTEDLSGATFAAYFGAMAYVGRGDPAGFEILDVPDGPFVLRDDAHWWNETTRELHWTANLAGRATASAATKATPLALSLTELTPWRASDDLVIACPNNGTITQLLGATLQLPADATAVSGAGDWSRLANAFPSFAPYLLDPAQGDDVLVLHMAATAEAPQVTSIVDWLKAPAPAQADGATATLAGRFAHPAVNAALDAAVDLDGFAALVAASYDAPMSRSWVASASATPNAAPDAEFAIQLARLADPSAALRTGHAAYANPLGSAFAVSMSATYYVVDASAHVVGEVSASSPGGAISLTAPAWLPTRTTLARTTEGIEIALAAAPAGVTGFTATVARPDSSFAGLKPIAFVSISGTRIVLPPDAFPAGDYILAVGASLPDGTYVQARTPVAHLP